MIATSTLIALALAAGYNRASSPPPSGALLAWACNSSLTVHQAIDGNPGVPDASQLEAVSRAILTWDAALRPCANLRLLEGDRTAARVAGLADQQNVILFRSQSCPRESVEDLEADCWRHSANALALTTTTYNLQSGEIFDADVELNSADFRFTTLDAPACEEGRAGPSCAASDVQGTLTHELGHLLGLDHSFDQGSTMAAYSGPGDFSMRTLDPSSARAMCEIYPAGALCEGSTSPSSPEPEGGCSTAGIAGSPLLSLWLLGAYQAGQRRRLARGNREGRSATLPAGRK